MGAVRHEHVAECDTWSRPTARFATAAVHQRAGHRPRGFAGGNDVQHAVERQWMTVQTAREQTTSIDRSEGGIDKSLKMDPQARKRRGIGRRGQ
jgi:hypothetical protein